MKNLKQGKKEGKMVRSFFFVLLSVLFVSVMCFAQETPAEEPVAESTAAVAEAPTLTLEAIQICTAVEDRQPVGAGTVFPDNLEKIYCFTKIVGATDAVSIYHVWYMGDKEVSKVSLSVKSSPWRTWSSKVLSGIGLGNGRVEVLAEDGTLLGKAEFEIQAATKTAEEETKAIEKESEKEAKEIEKEAETVEKESEKEAKEEVKAIEKEVKEEAKEVETEVREEAQKIEKECKKEAKEIEKTVEEKTEEPAADTTEKPAEEPTKQ
jgi:hypothetical protein